MKIIRVLLLLVVLGAIPLLLTAQTPPHPNGGNAPGPGNTPVGGGAPLGSGMIVMIALASAYGARKVFDFRRRSL
ncbi:MAG: hypothetical protein JW861_05375 [Bacteroidales bacterium]|nr:hypothetical protein [Bacteroidales bacterium]